MESPEPFEIKPFEPIHTSEVRELAWRIARDDYGTADEDPGSDEDLQDIAGAYAPPHGRFLVALDNGVVVGTGGIRRISDTDCELMRLYVQSEHRRRGVASSLMGDLVNFVRERGYRRLLLEIRPEMEPEAPIYRRYGFRDLEPEQAPKRPGRRFMAIHL